jgi:hypothetical protein
VENVYGNCNTESCVEWPFRATFSSPTDFLLIVLVYSAHITARLEDRLSCAHHFGTTTRRESWNRSAITPQKNPILCEVEPVCCTRRPREVKTLRLHPVFSSTF